MNLRPRHLSSTASAIASTALALSVIGCAARPTGTTAQNAAVGPKAAMEQYVEGYQAYRRGDIDTARRSLEAAVQNKPDLLMARSILGEIYRNNNDFASAARQYEVLSTADPYTLNNHYYLGVSYQLLSRFRESTLAYLKGLDIDPNDFRSNMNVGTAYLALGEVDNATRYLDHAARLDPNSAVAWSNLGVALDAGSNLVLAETAYRRAIERAPESQAIVQNLANNLLAQRKTGESIYLWEQIVEKNPTSFTQTKLAEAHTQGGDFTKALDRLNGVLAKDPRYLPAINAKAVNFIRQYELSGFSEEKFRLEAVALLNQSLGLNVAQPKVAEQLNKWKSASAIK